MKRRLDDGARDTVKQTQTALGTHTQELQAGEDAEAHGPQEKSGRQPRPCNNPGQQPQVSKSQSARQEENAIESNSIRARRNEIGRREMH